MESIPLGSGGPEVSRAGLGLAGMSGVYGPADEAESIATIPLIGTKRRDRLAEALGALNLRLTPADRAALEAAVPAGQVAGDRYDSAQMAALDSESP
jgi:aryl-alcohol dehydrogenase-like predicted oxidoreductase